MQFQKIFHGQRRNELRAVLNGIEPNWLGIIDRIEWGREELKRCPYVVRIRFVEK
jgi:hypothetical protein